MRLSTVTTGSGPRIRINLHPPTIVCCVQPGCRFTASARSEAAAVNALGQHIVQVHVREQAGPEAA